MKKKIYIVTKFNDWNIPPNVLYLIRKLSEEHEVVVIYERIKKKKIKYIKMIKKYGLFTVLDYILGKVLFKCIPFLNNKIFGNKKYLQLIREYVDDKFINSEDYLGQFADFVEVENLNDDKNIMEMISVEKPSIIISMGAPIFKYEFIKNIEKLNILFINTHIGITPKYKGVNPFIWSLKEKNYNMIGFTIHKVSTIVDGGDILYQKKVYVKKCKNLSQVDWLLLTSEARFVVNKILSGDIFKVESKKICDNEKGRWFTGFFSVLKAYDNLTNFSCNHF